MFTAKSIAVNYQKYILPKVEINNETLHNGFSNIPSATGAKNRVILGNITPCPIGGTYIE